MRDHFHEGFPSGRTAADAAFNASYNASWIRLNSNNSHRDGRQHARSCAIAFLLKHQTGSQLMHWRHRLVWWDYHRKYSSSNNVAN